MVKNGLKTLLLSLLILFFSSCAIESTYSLQEIGRAIKNICKDEFNIDVSVWQAEDTVWVYAPFDKLIDESGKWDEAASEDIHKIFLSLSRVFLNVDKPPKFYCFVASNIKEPAADMYIMGFTADMIKFQMKLISFKEREERVVFRTIANSLALGDKEGRHIPKYNLTTGEFISYLVRQDIERKSTSSEVKDFFQIDDLYVSFEDGKLEITFDIMMKEYKEGLPQVFEEAKKSVKKFLNIYSPCSEIVEIEINDLFNGKNRTYTKKAIADTK